MSLRTQIIRGQALSWVLVLIIGGSVFFSIHRNATSEDQATLAQAQLTQISLIETAMLDLETNLRGYLLTAKDQYLVTFNDARATIFEEIKKQNALIAQDDGDRALANQQLDTMREMQANINLWLSSVADPEIANIKGNPNAPINLQLQDLGRRLSEGVQKTIDTYIAGERAVFDARTHTANQTLVILKWVTAAGLLGAVAVSFLSSLWLANGVAKPTVRLGQSAQRLADGALDERVEESGARELKQLARTFNEMAEKLQASRAHLAEQNATLSAQTADLARAGEIEHTFSDVLRAFTASYNRDAILKDLLTLLAERHGFAVGAIYRYDEWEGAFVVSATHGTARDLQPRLDLHEGVVGQAVLDRRITILEAGPLLTINTGLDASPAPATVIVPV
jgi:CHASE3 domain sensor protein